MWVDYLIHRQLRLVLRKEKKKETRTFIIGLRPCRVLFSRLFELCDDFINSLLCSGGRSRGS